MAVFRIDTEDLSQPFVANAARLVTAYPLAFDLSLPQRIKSSVSLLLSLPKLGIGETT